MSENKRNRAMVAFGTNASRPVPRTSADANSTTVPEPDPSLRAELHLDRVWDIHVLDHEEIQALAAKHPAVSAYMVWYVDASNGAPAQNNAPVNHGPVYPELADALATVSAWEATYRQPMGVFEVRVIQAAEQLCVPVSKIAPDAPNLRLEPK